MIDKEEEDRRRKGGYYDYTMQCVVERLGALQSALDSIGLSQVILRHSHLSVSVFNYKMS